MITKKKRRKSIGGWFQSLCHEVCSLHRYHERENNEPHVMSGDLIRKMKPKNDDEKRGKHIIWSSQRCEIEIILFYYHMTSFKNNRVFVEVIMYARELETQLRSLKMHNEVSFKPLSESNITKKKHAFIGLLNLIFNSLLFQTDVMFEICAELGLYPSKYQRGNMMVRSLYLSCFCRIQIFDIENITEKVLHL